MKLLSDAELKEKLFWYFRRNFKSLNEAGREFQCSQSFISMVTHGKKPPTEKMMAAIGIKKVSGYVETDPTSADQ